MLSFLKSDAKECSLNFSSKICIFYFKFLRKLTDIDIFVIDLITKPNLIISEWTVASVAEVSKDVCNGGKVNW